MENSPIVSGPCCEPEVAESAESIIRSLLNREGDIYGKNYIKYRTVAREVYTDLLLHTVRFTKRYLLPVNKTTLTVKMPDTCLLVATVAVIDDCGKMHYLTHSPNITHDIVDVSQSDSCGCDCGCKGEVCKNIQHYEPIIEPKLEDMPDGSQQWFEAITRKRLDTDGNLIVERTFPIRKFNGDIWVGTELTTETEVICSLETKECGCVKDTAENLQKVDACCSANSFADECGCCNIKPEFHYGVSEGGNMLVMPPGFSFDKVLVRFYHEAKNFKDLMVPKVAKKAFIYGIKEAVSLFDDEENQYRIEKFEQRARREREKLIDLLSRWSIKGIYEVLTPKRRML